MSNYNNRQLACIRRNSSQAMAEDSGDIVHILEVRAVCDSRFVAIYHDSSHGPPGLLPDKVLGQCITQPHVLAAAFLEGAECMASEAGDGDDTSRDQLPEIICYAP